MAIRKNADGSVTVGIFKDKVEPVEKVGSTKSKQSDAPKKSKSK